MKPVTISFLLWLAAAAAAPAAAPRVLEAEWASELNAPALVISDKDCSGGLGVTIPDGTTEDDPLNRQAPLLSLWIGRIPAGATRLWVRVKWDNPCGNSFVCSVEPGLLKRTKVTGSLFGKWYWILAAELKASDSPAMLHAWNREDGICIDQFALLPADTRPPAAETPFPPGACPVVAAESIPSAEILFSLPGRKSGREALVVHPTHLIEPRTNRWARHEFFVAPGAPDPVTFWVRNTAGAETNMTLTVEYPAGLRVTEPGAHSNTNRPGEPVGRLSRTIAVTRNEPLKAVPLEVLCQDFAPGTRPMLVTLHAGDAAGPVLAERTLRVTRPLDWMIAGPFPDREFEMIARALERLIAAEEEDRPSDFSRNPDDPPEQPDWRPFKPDRHLGSCGRVDLVMMFGEQVNCGALAYTCVEAVDDGNFPFLIENDDGIRIWVNGKDVHSDFRRLPAISSRRITQLPLKKGRNTIIVRINQVREHWEFRLSPESPDSVQGLPFEKWDAQKSSPNH